MKFSSPSESESCTLFWGSGSDAGLFLPVFLEGNVMATFMTVDRWPRLRGSESTFWKRMQFTMRAKLPSEEVLKYVAALENVPWPPSGCWWHSRQTRCTRPPPMKPWTSLVSPASSSWSSPSKQRRNPSLQVKLQRPHTFTTASLTVGRRRCIVVTVFAKPPSEPKLSQLSSEEEEDVSMGTRGTMRKLLKLIPVGGGRAARVWTS